MNDTVYQSNNDGTGASPAIWGSCPRADMEYDSNLGFVMKDDFLKYSSTATTVLNASGLPTFEGSCTMTGSTTAGGELVMFLTTSNEEAGLDTGGGVSAPFVISDTAGASKKLWYETRIKKSLITNVENMFVGLASPGAAVADFIHDDGDDFSDVAVIGFVQWEADGDAIDFVYQANGQAFATLISGVCVPEADTYVKLGFIYDPEAESSKRIKVYVDGVEQSTYGTATQIAAATFPDAEPLVPIYAIKGSSGSDWTVTSDWYECRQLR